MRLLSKKVVTASRRNSRVRRASLFATPSSSRLISAPKPCLGTTVPLISAPTQIGTVPLISAPAQIGSKSNPIVIEESADIDSTLDALLDVPAEKHPLGNPQSNINSEFLANSLHVSISNPKMMASPSIEEQSPPTDGLYILIPISEDPAENSVENARVCLHNLRHVAKYHGFDLKRLQPETVAPPSQGPTVQAVQRDMIGPSVESQAYLDNFDMGNDVDRNDPVAVAMERDIATLHKRLSAKLSLNDTNAKASK